MSGMVLIQAAAYERFVSDIEKKEINALHKHAQSVEGLKALKVDLRKEHCTARHYRVPLGVFQRQKCPCKQQKDAVYRQRH